MGACRFNSWDAPPERRTPQQWMVGHYLTLLYDALPQAYERELLPRLAEAAFVEASANMYFSGLLRVIEAQQQYQEMTEEPPAPELPTAARPALYVGWGSGVASNMPHANSLDELVTETKRAATAGCWRLVGVLLCPEGIFEFSLRDPDTHTCEGEVIPIYRDGEWGAYPLPGQWFYFNLAHYLLQPEALQPARWAMSARLMINGLSKELGGRCLLPVEHFTLQPSSSKESPVPEPTTPQTVPTPKYVALIAGGPKDRIRELRPKLRALYDIELRHHWEWKRPNQFRRPLPKDVNLVLVLKDMISHPENEAVAKKAKDAGVRVLLIERKTCEIRATLEREGFAPLTGVAPVVGATVIPLHPEQVAEPPRKVRTKPRHPKMPPTPAAPVTLPTTLQFNHGRGKVVVDCEVLELWRDERTTAGGATIASEIYRDYCTWCQTNGAVPYHNTVFSQWLDRRGFERRNRHRQGKQEVMRALTLKPQATTPAPKPPTPTPAAVPSKKHGPDFDALDLFLLERCRVGEGQIATMMLYSAFSSWCLRHLCRTMTPQAMEKHLTRQRVPRTGEQWQVTVLPEAAPTPPPVANPTPVAPSVATGELRAKLLAQLTEIQGQLTAAGIREVVLTPTDLNLKR